MPVALSNVMEYMPVSSGLHPEVHVCSCSPGPTLSVHLPRVWHVQVTNATARARARVYCAVCYVCGATTLPRLLMPALCSDDRLGAAYSCRELGELKGLQRVGPKSHHWQQARSDRCKERAQVRKDPHASQVFASLALTDSR